jgi:hypothetical protein
MMPSVQFYRLESVFFGEIDHGAERLIVVDE